MSFQYWIIHSKAYNGDNFKQIKIFDKRKETWANWKLEIKKFRKLTLIT